MATADGLMGLGVSAEESKRTGWTIVSVTTSAATQNSSGGLLKGAGNKIVLATAAGSNGAVTLPSEAGLCDEIQIYNVSGNTALIFPQTSGTLNQGTANQSVAVATNASLYAVRVSATNWKVCASAAVTPS